MVSKVVFNFLRDGSRQQLRIASGLVLFLFTLFHLINHAVGLVGVDAMLEFQHWRVLVWRSWPGTIVLVVALVLHVVLAIEKLTSRSTWHLDLWESVRLVSGLLIPLLLLPHIVNTRVAHAAFGVDDTYVYELARLWPQGALTQISLLTLVWTHGCLGLHFWLRTVPVYRNYATPLGVLALVIPLAAISGFAIGGREVAAMTNTPSGLTSIKALTHWPSLEADQHLSIIRWRVQVTVWLGLVALAGVWFARLMQLQLAPRIIINFSGGPTISSPIGPTLLEMARRNGVPQAASCGGRGRCSTCRVRIDEGADGLPPIAITERLTLDSINAPANIRLACQLRPRADMTVTRLMRPNSADTFDMVSEADTEGVERILCLMFLDVRNFTRHMENKLPYDVVFLMNEFFATVGRAITSNGGMIDKFLGDGLLAVFGRYNGPEAGSREALRAAREIDLALDHYNARFAAEFEQPLEIGIGIHSGPVLLGRIGWGDVVDVTVIGHTVNAASRLEALTKPKACQIIISRDVATFAGWTETSSDGESIQVRGVAQPIEIITISRGRNLPPEILGPNWVT